VSAELRALERRAARVAEHLAAAAERGDALRVLGCQVAQLRLAADRAEVCGEAGRAAQVRRGAGRLAEERRELLRARRFARRGRRDVLTALIDVHADLALLAEEMEGLGAEQRRLAEKIEAG